MDKYQRDLDPEVAAAIANELSAQTRQCFDKVIETDWRLTQHNFLMNAGGAAAVLAYLGSTPTPRFAIWPLLLFLIGVVASGIEIRALLSVYDALHKDALRRRAGFTSNELRVKESVPTAGVTGCASHINHWSGVVSQVSFVLGVAVGTWMFFTAVP
jgi:hypothetical protein